MKQVLGREDLEGYEDGARVIVPPNTIVTTLAREYAAQHRIELVSSGADRIATGKDLIATVTNEVMRTVGALEKTATSFTPRGAPEAATASGHFAQCVACPNTQDDPTAGHRAVITATGKNRPGIVARLATDIADCGADILEISQTIVSGFFTIILIVDARGLEDSFAAFRDRIADTAKDIGCEAQVMHERILQSMHRL